MIDHICIHALYKRDEEEEEEGKMVEISCLWVKTEQKTKQKR